ncbi:hypothetical protein [Paraburkholderia sp. BCC1884]|uniref:hypothetical protein n=1 Tax=Paraburkholderia sp. BCC1884 TaxID=2562668 RepID=UPI0011834745|nr:hypothetical protein [Paraburkholderia sp. BCC1884]
MHATKIRICKLVEQCGVLDHSQIAEGLGFTYKNALVAVNALVNGGWLIARYEPSRAGGSNVKRVVSRSSLGVNDRPLAVPPLPPPLPNFVPPVWDDWWPRADALVVRSFNAMVNAGRATA